MIELVFIVCLKANPVACEERSLAFLSENGGRHACMARAQPELAEWCSAHPAFRIARWKCEDGQDKDIDI